MSTFGSGQAPVSTSRYRQTATGAATVYTVPSGRYAKVYFLEWRLVTSGTNSTLTIGPLSYSSNGATIDVSAFSDIAGSSDNRNPVPGVVLLDQNETITTNFPVLGDAVVSFFVEEFTRV